MPKNKLDELDNYIDMVLSGAAFKSKDLPVEIPAERVHEPQAKTNIEESPLYKDFETTTKGGFNDISPDTITPQELYQSNVDKGVQLKYDPSVARMSALEDSGIASRNESRQNLFDLNKIASNLKLEPQKNDYSALKDTSDLKPKEEDLLSLAIASLGPALAGLAIGGEVGYRAGGDAGPKSLKMWNDRQAQRAKNDASIAEQKSKRMIGASELLKAESINKKEYDKMYLDQINKSIDKASEIYGEDSDVMKFLIQERNKIENPEMFVKEIPKQVADYAQKVEDNANDLAGKKITGEAKAKARNSISQGKPPTEGERKNAMYYGTLVQGLKQYDDMVNKYGGKLPSEKSPNEYNIDYQLLSNQEGTQAAGIALQKLKGIKPEHREQIQKEIYIIDAILRPETGAAATVGEFLTKRAQYFGGATPEQKAEARIRLSQALNNLKVAKGRAEAPEVATGIIPKDKNQTAPSGMSFDQFRKWKASQK